MPLIAYYRVSTAEQGLSGLGLEAQRAAVQRYAEVMNETIRAEFTEVLSTRKERPEFEAALRMAVQFGDTLTVARLDRLSRDLHTITTLQKSGVKFLSVDMPGAEKMVIQMMGVIAEYERDTTSKRTKAALAAAKAKGVKLGAPDPVASLATVIATRSQAAEEYRQQLRPRVRKLRKEGLTLQQIADQFEAEGVAVPGSGKWHPQKVSRILKAVKGLDLAPEAEEPSAPSLPLFSEVG